MYVLDYDFSLDVGSYDVGVNLAWKAGLADVPSGSFVGAIGIWETLPAEEGDLFLQGFVDSIVELHTLALVDRSITNGIGYADYLQKVAGM